MTKHDARRTERLRRALANDPDPEAPLVGALLRLGFQRVLDRMLGALAAAGFDDINEAHFKVLRYPPPDGVRPSVLAERAKMTKQATNYLLVQLEELGYVRRDSDADTNGRLVSLTDRGWEVGAIQRRTVRAIEREWAKQVGEERFAIFLGVLREIAMPKDASEAHPARRSE